MEGVVVNNWNKRRVFVTGATGIVGSWLCRRLLDDGAYVVVLVRDFDPQSDLMRSGLVQRCNVVQGALEDYGAVERAIAGHDIDSVFHLGAQTIVGTALRSPLATFESNIRGSYHLLEACRVQRGLVQRVVVASSDKAYGESDVLPYVEDMPLQGRHPYDVSKSCTDLLALTYANTYEVPVSVARCGNIYGGGDLNWSRIVPGTILSALEGKRPVLRSDGSYTRDYIYVEDVVDAYICLAEATADGPARGQAFNFGPGRGIDVLGITNATLRAVGRDDLEPIILNEAKAEIRHQVLDSTKARTKLGWTPRFTLEEGLRRTVLWYQDFLAAR
ncbi:MAG: GDP-mannose 4,6-dehydratase [Deltaproteobacteria bacterium]|nr:GDP-mannose 4,6-dehydratase [Deltaproteobacteria bacterium]